MLPLQCAGVRLELLDVHIDTLADYLRREDTCGHVVGRCVGLGAHLLK